MSDAGKAVFLSYASQDAEAAKRICDALRAAGVEVWFDQSELVGGDAWDQKIRKQIRDCALLIPVISASTQARHEGYFRLEWRLADQRTHLMGRSKAFLLPVSIDGTRDTDADVPDSFVAVQWTKAPGGAVPPAFVARVQQLLSEEQGAGSREIRTNNQEPITDNRGQRPRWVAPVLGGLVVAIVALMIAQPWRKAPAPAVAPAVVASPSDAILARVRGTLRKIYTPRAELDLAAELLAQAAKADPANGQVFATWVLVDCRFLSESYDGSSIRRDAASRHIAQATSLAGTDPEVRLARAIAIQQLNRNQATALEATALLEGVLKDLPEDPRALGQLAWLAKDLPTADQWWERQARVPGWAATAHFNRGLRHTFEGDYRGGYAGVEEASRLDQGANIRLWKAYLEVTWFGDLAKARRTMAEVPAEAFIEDMAASAGYFVFYWARDYEGALKALQAIPRDFMESVATISPTGYSRGQALFKLGRVAAAENEWRAALGATERRLTTEPNDPQLLRAKALLLAVLGNKVEAEKIAKTVRELQPDTGDWLDDYLAATLLELDPAIARLQENFLRHRSHLTAAVLRLNPYYDNIRSDPRFIALQAEAEADPALSPTAPARAAGGTTSSADSKSVAVLAFANLSDDKANEYFSDGISEELLNVLAKVPGLKVSARTSAFYFKGKDTPIPEIAQKLGVAYVIEGSVRKQGDKVRITAQLIKAADGFHVWSDTFTRDLKDVFAVQDEIAGLVAQNLELKLGLPNRSSLVIDNSEANRLYFEALAAWNQRTSSSLAKASELLVQALALEPRFARAKALLSQTVSVGVAMEIPGMTPQRALELADEALALDPLLAQAHAARGTAMGVWADPGREIAIAELRRSIELDPNYATGHQWLGRELSANGRMAEALTSLRRAAELDPFSHRILDNYAQALGWSGDLPAAMTTLDRVLQLQPTSVQARQFRAILLMEAGRPEEAMAALRDAELAKVSPSVHAQVLLALGRRAEARALLTATTDAFQQGLILCALGSVSEGWPLLRPRLSSHRELIIWVAAPLVPREDPAVLQAVTDWGLLEAWRRAEAWRAEHPVRKGALGI